MKKFCFAWKLFFKKPFYQKFRCNADIYKYFFFHGKIPRRPETFNIFSWGRMGDCVCWGFVLTVWPSCSSQILSWGRMGDCVCWGFVLTRQPRSVLYGPLVALWFWAEAGWGIMRVGGVCLLDSLGLSCSSLILSRSRMGDCVCWGFVLTRQPRSVLYGPLVALWFWAEAGWGIMRVGGVCLLDSLGLSCSSLILSRSRMGDCVCWGFVLTRQPRSVLYGPLVALWFWAEAGWGIMRVGGVCLLDSLGLSCSSLILSRSRMGDCVCWGFVLTRQPRSVLYGPLVALNSLLHPLLIL